MTLRELKIGQSARIVKVSGSGELRQHFLDMGLIPGAEVTLIKYAPMGDPMELRLRGYELTLRLEEAEGIEVELLENLSTAAEERLAPQGALEHPGFGEEGRYHNHAPDESSALPDGTMLTFALAGNQNSGKTTLFNHLTGSNQHVGNFPGVTVDKKSGAIIDHPNTEIVDLPGIYSLSPYSSEELVSRSFIIDEKPRCIINIVDATNIERNLYLTLQLMELGVPVVLALNMMDELRGNGGSVHINAMEHMLGIPVVPIAAAKDEGLDELVQHALHVAKYQERPKSSDYCAKEGVRGAVHRCLHAIMHLIEDHAEQARLPLRFAATKVAENDALVIEALKLSQNEKDALEHIISQMEEERGLDRAAAVADMRFAFIQRVVDASVFKPLHSKEYERSAKIDAVLTGKYTAFPAFIAIMGLVFWLTFNVIGSALQDWLDALISGGSERLAAAMAGANVSGWLQSLVIDGVINGVGSVLSFLPIIVILFFFLSLLEDTGYMARVAFVTDRILRQLGLSGRSIVPMLIGFGCSVPGVMASRTLPSARDRRLTILLTPFMSCTAKLPIYVFFTAAFFPAYTGQIVVAIYAGGVIMAVLMAFLLKNTLFRGEAVPFVMELPNYRMPGWRNVGRLLWDKASDFLSRAFTVIFLATIAIWFLQSFDPHLAMVQDSHSSILAIVAGWTAPILQPLGLGDWRIVTALISGIMAKESVVSTLSVLFGSTAELIAALSPLSVSALLVFCLLYTPCVAAVAAIKRELGWGWTLGVVLRQCTVAWLASYAVVLLGVAMGLA